MSEVISIDKLRQFIAKIERLENDKLDLNNDIKDVYNEAKSEGFDVKIMKQVLKLKKLDKNKLAEQDAIIDLYRSALDV